MSTVYCALHCLSHSYQQHWKVATVIPISLMRKLRLIEVKELSQVFPTSDC